MQPDLEEFRPYLKRFDLTEAEKDDFTGFVAFQRGYSTEACRNTWPCHLNCPGSSELFFALV